MTTQALSERPTRGYFNGAYFLGELRRSWSSCLLYFLAYFFALVLPLLDDLTTYRVSDFYSVSNAGIQSIHYYVPWLFCLIAMLCALWAGIMACGYLQKRTSAYHFGSMPIRREGILAVKCAVALTDFVIALLPNILMGMALCALMREPWWFIPVIGLYSLLAFAMALAFTVLCGTLCGTHTFHFLFTGVAAFAGPILLCALWLIADTTCRFLNVQYLLWSSRGDSIFHFASPFIYMIATLGMELMLSPLGVTLLILFTLACFVGAWLIVRRRPTEAAESPVVFRPVAAAFKYFVMSMATIFGGYFFGEIFSGGDFWVLFGMVCGGMLSFMLMNVLIHRTARKMFAGLAGLCVFAILLSGGCFGVYRWYVYKDTHGYAAEHIASVAFTDNRRLLDTFAVSDPDAIEAAAALIDGYFAEVAADEHNGEPVVEAYVIPDTEKTLVDGGREVDIIYRRIPLDGSNQVYIRQTTKWGTSRTWAIRLDQYPALGDETVNFARAFADSEDFREQYIAMLLSPVNSSLFNRIYRAETGEKNVAAGLDRAAYIAASPTYAAIEAELRALVGYDLFQSRRVATTHWYDVPVYETQSKLLEVILNEGVTLESLFEEDITSMFAEGERVVVHRLDENRKIIETVELTDETLLRALAGACVCLSYDHPYYLTDVDEGYVLQNIEYGRTFYFLEGKVPDALVALFE